MKKTERKIMIVLTLTLAVLLAMSTFSFAETNTVDGGKYVFDGDTISTDGSGSISETISNMEPGDSVTINLTYTNDTDDTTDWYMKSDVIKTLEDSSTATDRPSPGRGCNRRLVLHPGTRRKGFRQHRALRSP